MKYILFLFLISCVPANKKQKAEPRTQIEERKRPTYNQQFLTKQVNSSEEEALRAERIRLLREEEEYYMRRKAAEEGVGRNATNPRVSGSDYSLTQQPITRQEPVPAPKPQVLEILGSQGKTNYSAPMPAREEILIPPPQNASNNFQKGNFIISTSPTYTGILLEEARQILEQFGTVKSVREGEKFALKLEPKEGLQTEEEAKVLLKKIISTSFFDIYIEKK